MRERESERELMAPFLYEHYTKFLKMFTEATLAIFKKKKKKV